MKKIILVLTLSLSLSGCAALADFVPKLVETAFNLPTNILTSSIDNPVTPYMLYQIESGLTPAVVGLNVYRRTCWASVPKGTPASCKNTTRTLQKYTRRLPPLLTQAKAFVDSGDQVNAKVVYAEIMKTVTAFRSTANKAGINP